MNQEQLEPEILLDVSAPNPQQQKIIDIATKLVAGTLILLFTGEELISEFKKHRINSKPKAFASIDE